jgi:hypothetical protein
MLLCVCVCVCVCSYFLTHIVYASVCVCVFLTYFLTHIVYASVCVCVCVCVYVCVYKIKIVISGFRRHVDETGVLLGCSAALSGSSAPTATQRFVISEKIADLKIKITQRRRRIGT